MTVWLVMVALIAAVALAGCVGLALRLRGLRMAVRDSGAITETRVLVREAALREQVAAQERERIYSDLHDDLGAKLLSMIYRAESPAQADQARVILQDLRDVVTRSRGTPGSLGDVLADIRAEATQRLSMVDIGLDWDASDDVPDPLLDTGQALHLHRIVREAISNTIRHAQARRLRIRVRVRDGELLLELTDDGGGVSSEVSLGAGMRNMRSRAGELDGRIDWVAGTEGGAKVLLHMPLEPGP